MQSPLSRAQSAAESARIRLNNYDIETEERLQEMETRIQQLLLNLRRRCEAEIARLPERIHQMTAAEFLGVHEGDTERAANARLLHDTAQKTATRNEELHALIEQSNKKRKRNVGDTPSIPPSPLPRSKRQFIDPALQTPKASSQQQAQRRKVMSPVVEKTNVQPLPFAIPSGEFTFQCTLESLAKGLKEEVDKTNMPAQEKSLLEARILSLVESFRSRQT